MDKAVEKSDNIINVDLKKGEKLSFSLNIVSNKPVSSKPLIRLVLSITDKISVVLTDGKLKKSGEIEFEIPAMHKMLAPRKYYCDLEMVIDNNFYVPMSFIINFY